MDLEHLGKKDGRLHALLRQSQQWRKLDGQVKQVLPANLRAHFQTACVEDGCLVLLAANNMVSSRLRMITPGLLPQFQKLHADIRQVRVKVVPARPEVLRENRLRLGGHALESFRLCAGRLQHHPELARALLRLAEKHGKEVGGQACGADNRVEN